MSSSLLLHFILIYQCPAWSEHGGFGQGAVFPMTRLWLAVQLSHCDCLQLSHSGAQTGELASLIEWMAIKIEFQVWAIVNVHTCDICRIFYGGCFPVSFLSHDSHVRGVSEYMRERKKLELCKGKRLPDRIYFVFFPSTKAIQPPRQAFHDTSVHGIPASVSSHLCGATCCPLSLGKCLCQPVSCIHSLEIYRYPSLHLDNLLPWNHYVRCQYIKRSLLQLYFLQAVGVSQAAHSLWIVSVWAV